MAPDDTDLIRDVPTIKAPSGFGPSDYSTLALVAQVPGSKILDCTALAMVPGHLCEIVAKEWAAPPGSVPRLAIVVQIDAWSLVRLLAPRGIQALVTHGTEMRLFYARQLSAGHVARWVLDRTEPGHELAATLEDLDTVWRGSPTVGNVLDDMLTIIQSDTSLAQAFYLATLSSVARKFAGPSRGVAFANDALALAADRTDPWAIAARAKAEATLAYASSARPDARDR